MDKIYKVGQLLQINTKNSEMIAGRFFNITKDKSKISLYNCKEFSIDYINEGVVHLYNSEITSIIQLIEPDQQTCLKITQKECEAIIKVSKQFKFINQVDAQFHEALKDINTYNYVAVSNDGASMGRKCQMPFMVMSTLHQIYIFDIQIMHHHAFDAGLRQLLESESPKKIVHDCRKLSDCLSHKHNVKLASVFDTQVGDIIIRKNRTGQLPKSVKSLAECLNVYLGLKLNTIDEKLDLVECSKRPLSLELKETLSKNNAYLHRLSETIQDELMFPFIRGVEFFLDNIRTCDDFEALELCGKHQQLPKEFKSAIEY